MCNYLWLRQPVFYSVNGIRLYLVIIKDSQCPQNLKSIFEFWLKRSKKLRNKNRTSICGKAWLLYMCMLLYKFYVLYVRSSAKVWYLSYILFYCHQTWHTKNMSYSLILLNYRSSTEINYLDSLIVSKPVSFLPIQKERHSSFSLSMFSRRNYIKCSI